LTNSLRAAFLGVGMPHGDAPGTSSSAKREDFDAGAGIGSSSKREMRDFELAAAAADSSGDDPNSDIAKRICGRTEARRCLRRQDGIIAMMAQVHWKLCNTGTALVWQKQVPLRWSFQQTLAAPRLSHIPAKKENAASTKCHLSPVD
jgi:hypothetical protein